MYKYTLIYPTLQILIGIRWSTDRNKPIKDWNRKTVNAKKFEIGDFEIGTIVYVSVTIIGKEDERKDSLVYQIAVN